MPSKAEILADIRAREGVYPIFGTTPENQLEILENGKWFIYWLQEDVIQTSPEDIPKLWRGAVSFSVEIVMTEEEEQRMAARSLTI